MGFDDLFEPDDSKKSDGLGKRLEILFTFIDSAVARILDSLQTLDERITQVEARITAGVGPPPSTPGSMTSQVQPAGMPPPPTSGSGMPPPPAPGIGAPPPPPGGQTSPPPPPGGGYPSASGGAPPPPPSSGGTLQSELNSAMQRRSSAPSAPPAPYGSTPGAPGSGAPGPPQPGPGGPGGPGGASAPPSPMMLQAQLKDELRAAFAKIRSGLNEEDR